MFKIYLNKTDKDGRTALHYAIVDNKVFKAKLLLTLGSDSNIQDKKGWSPLHAAAQSQNEEITRLLLKHGANVHAKNSHGNTPLSVALSSYRGKSCSSIRLLIKAGSTPHEKNNYGISPYNFAQDVANYDLKQFFKAIPTSPAISNGRTRAARGATG
jgi:ankyrin repeat protein